MFIMNTFEELLTYLKKVNFNLSFLTVLRF